MARRKKVEETKPEVKAEVKKAQVVNPRVVYHLDVDPNDPRNVAPAKKLPSLDD